MARVSISNSLQNEREAIKCKLLVIFIQTVLLTSAPFVLHNTHWCVKKKKKINEINSQQAPSQSEREH